MDIYCKVILASNVYSKCYFYPYSFGDRIKGLELRHLPPTAERRIRRGIAAVDDSFLSFLFYCGNSSPTAAAAVDDASVEEPHNKNPLLLRRPQHAAAIVTSVRITPQFECFFTNPFFCKQMKVR